MRTSVVITVLASAAFSAGAVNAQAPSAPCQVTSTVTASSATILPGEPLDLAFHLKNTAGTDISLAMPSETIGSVTVGIAGTEEPPAFKRYLGPGWGTEDSVQTPRPLAKDASIDLNLRVLYQVQRQAPYTFSTPGTFRVKVRYQDQSVCPAGVETPVLTIRVVEPAGADLVAWNALKTCARCAHFLHTGRASSNAVSQEAVARVRSVAKQYPKSRYTTTIRKQLDVLEAKEKDDNGKHLGQEKDKKSDD